MARKGSKQPQEWRDLMSSILKGRPLSEEHKKALSEAHKGVKLSKQHSEAIKEGQLNSPNKEKMAFWKGKKLSEETKKKMSLSRIGNQNTKGKKMPSSRKNIIRMRKRGRFETGIEKKIKKLLAENEVEFEQEKYFRGVGLVDFYLPKHKLVIECDGGYWHGTKAAKERDKNRDKKLKEIGIFVLRLKEKEINEEIQNCWFKIRRLCYEA